MQSVPCVVSLSSKNMLLFNPAEVHMYKVTANRFSVVYYITQEISLLHGDNMYFNNIQLPANATYSLGRIGNQV